MKKNKEKRSKKKILKVIAIILLVVITLLMIAFSILYFVILNPKENISKLFNTSFDKIIEIVNLGSTDKSFTSINKGNIKIDTNIDKYNNLSNYEIEYDIEHDRINKKTFIDLKLGDEEEKIESTFYKEDNNLYINFPYIIKSIIKIPLNEYGYLDDDNKLFNYKKEDSNYILTIIKNSFIKNISDNNLKNSISNYHIKSSYLIDNKEFNNLLNNIVNDLNNDEKAMDILLNSFSLDKDKLNSLKDNLIKKFNDKCEYIEINMFISLSFKFDKLTINTKKYNIDMLVDDINDLTIKSNNKEVLKSSFNNKLFKCTINRKSNIIETDLKIDTAKDELNLEGYVNFKNENNNYIKLDLIISTLLNEKISEFDIVEAKSFNQFTNKDLKSVYKIIDLINKYIELFTSSKEHNISLKK